MAGQFTGALAGYLAGQQEDRQAQAGQLQQAQSLMGILSAVQAQQKQQEALAQQQAERAYLAEPAVRAKLQAGDIGGVLSGAPGMNLDRALKLGELNRKSAGHFTSAGDGILNTSSGDVQLNPFAKEQRPQNQSNVARLMAEKSALPAGDPRHEIYANAIRKESETAKQISPTVVMPRQEQPLVSIVGEDGKPTLVRREEAIGKMPWTGSPDQLALKVTGGRESVYVQRMMMGANQAAKDLANVVQLPLTASTGILGGRRQGAGLLDAGKEVLANKATGQEAQAYNAMATGFQRSLAQIESAGLMPSGSLTHQMDAVLFKEGDTNLTKLHKLAQTRQIVEAGMEVIDANPRVSPEEKSKIKSVLDSVRKSVPFTHSNLIQLQVAQEQNPSATLKDVIGKPGGAAPKNGDKAKSKSGKPMTFDGTNWVYD